MDKARACLNIEHYGKLLDTETDPNKRETLLHLLAEEEAKLAAFGRSAGECGSPGTKILGLGRPFPPVRRTHVDQLSGIGIDPSTDDSVARERQCVGVVLIDDRQFKITVGRRCGNILPLHG